jgi:hypothetical protein
MADQHKKIEAQLRTEAYEALLKLSFARARKKRRIVKCLSKACSGLNELIIQGKTPPA